MRGDELIWALGRARSGPRHVVQRRGTVLGHGARRGAACRPNWGGNGCPRVRMRAFSEREPEPGARGGCVVLRRGPPWGNHRGCGGETPACAFRAQMRITGYDS